MNNSRRYVIITIILVWYPFMFIAKNSRCQDGPYLYEDIRHYAAEGIGGAVNRAVKFGVLASHILDLKYVSNRDYFKADLHRTDFSHILGFFPDNENCTSSDILHYLELHRLSKVSQSTLRDVQVVEIDRVITFDQNGTNTKLFGYGCDRHVEELAYLKSNDTLIGKLLQLERSTFGPSTVVVVNRQYGEGGSSDYPWCVRATFVKKFEQQKAYSVSRGKHRFINYKQNNMYTTNVLKHSPGNINNRLSAHNSSSTYGIGQLFPNHHNNHHTMIIGVHFRWGDVARESPGGPLAAKQRTIPLNTSIGLLREIMYNKVSVLYNYSHIRIDLYSEGNTSEFAFIHDLVGRQVRLRLGRDGEDGPSIYADLDRMASSDVLIAGGSAYAELAGALNHKGVVIGGSLSNSIQADCWGGPIFIATFNKRFCASVIAHYKPFFVSRFNCSGQ